MDALILPTEPRMAKKNGKMLANIVPNIPLEDHVDASAASMTVKLANTTGEDDRSAPPWRSNDGYPLAGALHDWRTASPSPTRTPDGSVFYRAIDVFLRRIADEHDESTE